MSAYERDSVEAPLPWTPRRMVMWSIGGFVLLVLLGVATGYLAGMLDHGSGERVWRERLRLVIVALPAVLMVAAGARFWRRSCRVERSVSGGEARAIRRSRGFWTVMGVQVIAGTVVGGLGAHYLIHPESMTAETGEWLALALAVVTFVAMLWGCIALYPRIDELELQDNLWGTAAGGGVMMLVYPPWYLLWRGNWVPEPAHEALFLLLFVVTMAVYGWRKTRR